MHLTPDAMHHSNGLSAAFVDFESTAGAVLLSVLFSIIESSKMAKAKAKSLANATYKARRTVVPAVSDGK